MSAGSGLTSSGKKFAEIRVFRKLFSENSPRQALKGKKFAEIRIFRKLFSENSPGQALKDKKFAEIRVFRKLFTNQSRTTISHHSRSAPTLFSCNREDY